MLKLIVFLGVLSATCHAGEAILSDMIICGYIYMVHVL